MLRGDIAALEALWADELLVNSSANLIAGRETLLELIRNGRLRLRTYERRTVRVVTVGDIVVATGNETSQLSSELVPDQLFCSYMNIWIKRRGAWKLAARHVGLIERKRAQA